MALTASTVQSQDSSIPNAVGSVVDGVTDDFRFGNAPSESLRLEPILGHLQVPPEHKGPKSEAFRVMVGVLKNRLRSSIPAMSDAFHARVREAVALEMASSNEYHPKLRAEALEYQHAAFGRLNEEMPYLDSFIKETARLSPGPICTMSAPRTVMVPYTSSEGYHVPAGNWLAVPQLALMRDDRIWPRAAQFEGFRFVDESKGGASETRLTHPSYEFPFWGSVRHAWWVVLSASGFRCRVQPLFAALTFSFDPWR
ncbi:MAG: hypothetical protein Q9167_005636 [Letrouitia subvulpina]